MNTGQEISGVNYERLKVQIENENCITAVKGLQLALSLQL